MKTETFMKKVVAPRLRQCCFLLENIKNKEYSRNNDKLHNFKRTAHIRDISIIEAWDGMFNKHLTSILDMIDDARKGVLPTEQLMNDKITDGINYLLLFEGIVKEMKDENK
jgi:hypothetical protein